MWYSLDKKSKVSRQGVIKVRLALSSEKNSQVAAQEHRHLLRILLLHELEMSKVSASTFMHDCFIVCKKIITLIYLFFM